MNSFRSHASTHHGSAETIVSQRRSMTRSRWAAIGAAIAVTIGGGGLLGASAAPGSTPAVFVAVSPCRLMDTRAPGTIGTRAVPLAAEDTATVSVRGTNGNCTLPDTAAAVVMNVTVTNQTDSSFLTVHRAGVERPLTSSLNWTAADGDVANAVTVDVSASGEISFYNHRGSTDLVADVVGYYTSAPLGAYYTKSEVDALIAQNPAGVGPVGPKGDTGAKGDKGDKGDTGDAVLANVSCSTDQVISWDGTEWACADNTDTLAALSCTTNQSVGWDGSAWVCRSAPIVATLSSAAFPNICCTITDRFQTYSPNVDTNRICDIFFCELRLIDVTDHNTCQIYFTGNSNANQLHVVPSQNGLVIDNLYEINNSEPLYVNISCAT